MNSKMVDLGRRVLNGEQLARPDVLSLVELSTACPHDLLYWANCVRTARFGNSVAFCSIIAGKLGGCGEDCAWCAQSQRKSAGTTAVPRILAVPPDSGPQTTDFLSVARDADSNGARCFCIVNSGRRPSERDLQAVETASRALHDQGLCHSEAMQGGASLGQLTDDQARRLAAAGVVRYNHNLETSRRFYRQVVTTHTYDDRLATLRAAREAGMSLCCGGIFGLGETWEDRVDLALTLRDEVRPQTVPLNFLHAIPGTPLEHAAPLTPGEILAIIAIFRLVLPNVDIKVAGGREKNLRDMQSWIFYAGATSCLIGNYLTTFGRPAAQDMQMVADLGLRVVREGI